MAEMAPITERDEEVVLVVLNFKAPPDLAAALRQRAELADRTVSQEIRHALRVHLAAPDPDGRRVPPVRAAA